MSALQSVLNDKSAPSDEITKVMDSTVNTSIPSWINGVKTLTKAFDSIQKRSGGKSETEKYIRSVKALVRLVPPTKRIWESEDASKRAMARKMFTELIVAALQVSMALPELLTRQLINYTSRHALGHMSNPLLLVQFYLSALSGAPSLACAALTPLTKLMAQGGLGDDCDFFAKIYALLHPQILADSPRTDLLPLLSQVLESSMIPAAWIAAFAKRIARVGLISLDHAISLWAVTAVYSLIQRNPLTCRALLHSDRSGQEGGDPFSFHSDLQTAAIQVKDSSLWELELLMNHGCAAVARLAAMFRTNLFSRSAKRIEAVDFATLNDAALFSQERKQCKKRTISLAFLGGTSGSHEDIIDRIFQ